MMRSNPQWPISLLLLQMTNRLFIQQLQIVPDRSVRTTSKGTQRLLKQIIELATTYILFVQTVSSITSETPIVTETPSEASEKKYLAIEGMVGMG